METLSETYFRHNLWANLRLLDACAALSDHDLEARVPGTFGTIRETLQHICAAEELNLGRLSGQIPEDLLIERKEFTSFEVLRQRARRSGEGLIALSGSLSPAQPVTFRFRGEYHTTPAAVILLQAITHATEHRAQIAVILTQQGVTPPLLDGWTYHLEAGTA